jgi:hypothetical protein
MDSPENPHLTPSQAHRLDLITRDLAAAFDADLAEASHADLIREFMRLRASLDDAVRLIRENTKPPPDPVLR